MYGVDTSNSAVYQLQNTGRAVFYGLEADIGIMPVPAIMLGVQYTWLERKNLSRPEVLFTDVPRHRIFGYIKYEIPDRFYILFDSGFNTERPSTSDGQYVAEAFFLYNLKASVMIRKMFSVEASVNNLFDAAYSYYEGYPQEGRNFTLSVNYSFSKN